MTLSRWHEDLAAHDEAFACLQDLLDPSSFATTVVKAFREWGQGLLRLATALVRENAALERENATLRDRIAELERSAALDSTPPAASRPPATAVRRGGELHIRPGGLPPGAVELASADRGHDVWRIEAGDTLRAVLERWGVQAGVEVLFLTDRCYRLHRGQAFEGAFIDAVRTLFFALSHLPHPPAGEFTASGKSLAVTHRAPKIPANGDKP